MIDLPMVLEIAGVFALSCLFSLGGGNGPLILTQAHWVETGVLAVQPFSFALGLAYLLPGPKATFAAGIGYYLAGIPGAAAAVLGLIVPTALSAAAANRALAVMQRVVERARPATGYVLAGIIAATALGTAVPLALGAVEIVIAGIAAWLIAFRDVEPIWLILGGLVVGGIRSLPGVGG